MKILFTSIGTRGDMEPFLALAEIAKDAGHDTYCLMPEQFQTMVEEGGHGFGSLGPEFLEMLDSDTGKIAMGASNSTWAKIRAYSKLQREYVWLNSALMERQAAYINNLQPDRIVHSLKAVFAVVWGNDKPGKSVALSPVPYVLHPTREYSHIGFNRNFGNFWNRKSYGLALWGLTRMIFKNSKKLPHFGKLSKSEIKKALLQERAIYTISPTLFSKPKDWPDHVKIVGFHERSKTIDWTPPEGLVEFLSGHKKVLLLTFGSMNNPDPLGKTALFLRVLSQLKIPAIINTAGGGLSEPESYDDSQFFFVNRIPYDWVFPKVYAVIHHGGSGTTHTAIKYGCANMIVPHIIDQFYWNKLIAAKGLGPLGIPITKLKQGRLTSKVQELWELASYKKTAEVMSCEMKVQPNSQEFLDILLSTS